jgi:hypothetical protein
MLLALALFGFGFAFDVRAVRPLVRLDIHKPAFFIADGIEFAARSAAVSGSFGHIVSFSDWMTG